MKGNKQVYHKSATCYSSTRSSTVAVYGSNTIQTKVITYIHLPSNQQRLQQAPAPFHVHCPDLMFPSVPSTACVGRRPKRRWDHLWTLITHVQCVNIIWDTAVFNFTVHGTSTSRLKQRTVTSVDPTLERNLSTLPH